MKKLLYLLLAGSIGLNVGLLVAELSGRSANVPRGGPPPSPDHRAPPRDPEVVVRDHVNGMTEHLGLTPEQQRSIRDALRLYMPELVAQRTRAEDANRRISEAFAAREFDARRFASVAGEARGARAAMDSVSVLMLLEEAAVLNPRQRAEFSRIAPTIHVDPRRTPPGAGRPPMPERR